MTAFHVDGYVIVSADGMLADATGVMPDSLKFEGDKEFFTAALDHADLIVHGRNSHEGQSNSPRRKRIVLTRRIGAIAPDPANARAIERRIANDAALAAECGSVDALQRECDLELTVGDYREHAIGAGADAQATAYVQVRDSGDATLYGVGIDGNIVTASLKAVASAATRVSQRTGGQ